MSDVLGRGILRQDAVWWPKLRDDQFGKPVFGDPTDQKVRWTDVAQEYVDDKGTKTVSNSIIFVGVDMKAGDALRRGTVAELASGKTPLQQTGAAQIKRFRKTPNRTARKFLRKAIL